MAGTTRMLMKQKRPVKRMNRRQRKSFKDNPINGIPWANWIEVVTGADPTITSITPSTLPASSGPTTLTLVGTNYGPGSIVEADQAALSTVFVSGTSLRATFDPSVAKTVNFTVRNSSGKESADKAFVVSAGAEDPEADPTQSWTKARIVEWLVAKGVAIGDDAEDHFTKDELLAIVAAYLNEDPELDDLLGG